MRCSLRNRLSGVINDGDGSARRGEGCVDKDCLKNCTLSLVKSEMFQHSACIIKTPMFTPAKMPISNPASTFLFLEAPNVDVSLAKAEVEAHDTSAGSVTKGAGEIHPEIPVLEVSVVAEYDSTGNE